MMEEEIFVFCDVFFILSHFVKPCTPSIVSESVQRSRQSRRKMPGDSFQIRRGKIAFGVRLCFDFRLHFFTPMRPSQDLNFDFREMVSLTFGRLKLFFFRRFYAPILEQQYLYVYVYQSFLLSPEKCSSRLSRYPVEEVSAPKFSWTQNDKKKSQGACQCLPATHIFFLLGYYHYKLGRWLGQVFCRTICSQFGSCDCQVSHRFRANSL